MLENLVIHGVRTEVDDDLAKYVTKKIGKLDTYIPRRARESVTTEVRLLTDNAKDKRESTCEVTMTLPHESLYVKETTVNMYAAIDIVEAKLKNQLKRYKGHAESERRGVRRLIGKLRARTL